MLAVVTHIKDGASNTVSGSNIKLTETSIVKLKLSPQAVKEFERSGENLVIHLNNGTTVCIVNFYKYFVADQHNELVLEDDNGALWVGNYSDGLADFNFTEIQSVDQLVEKDRGILPILLGLGGLGAVGAAIAGGSGGDSDSKPGTTPFQSRKLLF